MSKQSLHSALKEWIAEPGDQLEVGFDGFRIDIVRGDLLIEIQTRSFSALKEKLWQLVPDYPLRLVYPIAQEKWIVKQADPSAKPSKRRKSPKRGRIEDLFAELVSFPSIVQQPNFSLEVLLIQEEELRRHDSRRAWRRRGWVTERRRLLRVLERRLLAGPQDYARLLPAGLQEPFTTAALAQALGRPRRLAQQMAYCLRKMNVIEDVGHEDRSVLYARVRPMTGTRP